MSKTRQELVLKAISILGIGSVGQDAPADDYSTVDDEVETFFAELYAKDRIYVQIDAIEDAWFLPLARMLAERLISDFSIGAEEAADIVRNAVAARADLFRMASVEATYETQRVQFF